MGGGDEDCTTEDLERKSAGHGRTLKQPERRVAESADLRYSFVRMSNSWQRARLQVTDTSTPLW